MTTKTDPSTPAQAGLSQSQGFHGLIPRAVDADYRPRKKGFFRAQLLGAVGKALQRLGVALQKFSHGDDVLGGICRKAQAGDVEAQNLRRAIVHDRMKAARVFRGNYVHLVGSGIPDSVGWSDLPGHVRDDGMCAALVFVNGRVLKDRHAEFLGRKD